MICPPTGERARHNRAKLWQKGWERIRLGHEPACATALCDKNLRISLGQNGYDYVKRNHDWDAQARKYLTVYEALIAGGKY